MRLVYRAGVRWGLPAAILASLIILSNMPYLYLLVRAAGAIIFFQIILLYLPVIALDIIFMPMIISIFPKKNKAADPNLELYDTGIRIKKEFIGWDKIRSISFQTGRTTHDYSSFEGFRLPAVQRMFVLDKTGKEISCAIDIDYAMKGSRKKNNLIILKEYLLDMGKGQLISDWAEKR